MGGLQSAPAGFVHGGTLVSYRCSTHKWESDVTPGLPQVSRVARKLRGLSLNPPAGGPSARRKTEATPVSPALSEHPLGASPARYSRPRPGLAPPSRPRRGIVRRG